MNDESALAQARETIARQAEEIERLRHRLAGERFGNEARSLARLLEAFGTEKDGLLVWSGDSPDIFTPDYMTGYAGVAVCLLRLGDPEEMSHQLSRPGFRRRRTSSSPGVE
jgi:hypothetical protein